MDRRPASEDQGRVKRQKIERIQSRSSDESDDGGGVMLGNYQPAEVKPKKEDLDVESSRRTERKGASSSEKAINRKRKKDEDEDEASNPYLAEQYEGPPKKKAMDPRANPYLAHNYEEPEEDEGGYSNGFVQSTHKMNGSLKYATSSRLPRHRTTAAMAENAENGPNNHFSGQPLSSQYFGILKTRRNLPVHQQRYA